MVEILDETQQYPSLERLEETLAGFMAQLEFSERDVTIVLVDDATIHRMNLEHREVDAPTDVLSYPTHEPDDVGMPEIPHLGDVIISLDTAAAQGDEAGHGLEAEVLTLAAHGITHLLGYDHPTEDAWSVFKNHQALILSLHRP